MPSTNTASIMLFLGGPMHGTFHEMPDTTLELFIRNKADKTWSPNGWDRYTRRRICRIAEDEHPEIALLFAHETWLDEEIGATHVPESQWKPAGP